MLRLPRRPWLPRGFRFQIFSRLSNSETIFDSDLENIDLKVGSEVVVELEGGYIIAVFG
jgi:hypothetical protein